MYTKKDDVEQRVLEDRNAQKSIVDGPLMFKHPTQVERSFKVRKRKCEDERSADDHLNNRTDAELDQSLHVS